MKRMIGLLSAAVLMAVCTACANQPDPVQLTLQEDQMRAICELATTDCYYNVVKKVHIPNAGKKFFVINVDKKFWVEYSGIVQMGIDASLVDMQVDGTEVTITLPAAKVLNCEVDNADLSEDSYIVDKDSIAVSLEDVTKAMANAQEELEEKAANDQTLLDLSQQRARELLEGYVNTIGEAIGTQYTIQWVYVDSNGNPPETAGESAQ